MACQNCLGSSAKLLIPSNPRQTNSGSQGQSPGDFIGSLIVKVENQAVVIIVGAIPPCRARPAASQGPHRPTVELGRADSILTRWTFLLQGIHGLQ